MSAAANDSAPLSVRFFVAGTPAPQGSKRAIGRGRMIEQGKERVDAWRSAVAYTVQREAFGVWFDGPVSVHIAFSLKRPAKPKWKVRPASAPDIDKLLRATLDGLVDGGLLADDGLVVDVHMSKWWAEGRAGATIIVEDVPDA